MPDAHGGVAQGLGLALMRIFPAQHHVPTCQRSQQPTLHVSGRPGDTPYRLREFSHVDPEGNLLRIGSPLQKAEV
jgi:hypothetical protein